MNLQLKFCTPIVVAQNSIDDNEPPSKEVFRASRQSPEQSSTVFGSFSRDDVLPGTVELVVELSNECTEVKAF